MILKRDKYGKVEDWLKVIQSFGGDSPVIIVLNKIDTGPNELDRKRLKDKYDNIKAFVNTSCQTAQGIGELSSTIKGEILKLEHIKFEWIKSWFNIKEQLENMQKDYITYEDYEIMCEAEGINKESRETLIRYLHCLGVVFNYGDDINLENMNILNPEWVTKGVYKILNSEKLTAKTDKKGLLNIKDLDKILHKKDYPRGKRSFILGMMEKFELCFKLDNKMDYLIPDLFSKAEPDFEFAYDDTLAFQYHYDFLPSNVISRFIVKMHPFICDDIYWRTGVMLADKGNKALVKADMYDKKIYIYINGEENIRREFLSIIRFNLGLIHNSIREIDAREFVALPENQKIVIAYEALLNLEKRGVKKHYYAEHNIDIDVKALLDGVDTEERRHPETRLKELEKQFELLNARMEAKENALIIATDVNEKFKLEKQIEEDKINLDKILKEMQKIKDKLELKESPRVKTRG